MSWNYSKLCDIDAIVSKVISDIRNDIYEHFHSKTLQLHKRNNQLFA